jgi:pimeloyl-ACP methyl ester carboxylesterase
MHKLWKVTRVILLGIVTVLLIIVVAGLSYRAYRQHQNANASTIRTPNGIDEAMFIRIGGIEQWVTIRGQDRTNPVVLVLDGGPGAAGSVFAPSGLEKDFVVVEWDQPGAGKTFGRAGRSIDTNLSIEQVARDGNEVAEFLRQHLHAKKIALLGISWGTVVGINMIKLRPDLFFAYVGTGQVVNMQRGEAMNYEQLLAKARAKGDRVAVSELEKITPPPYVSAAALRTQRTFALSYETGAPSGSVLFLRVLFAPRYSLGDVANWFRGFFASQEHFMGSAMNGPMMAVDLPALGTHFDVPVFVFQGSQDDFTPSELAEAYVASIEAPEKLFVSVPGAGHFAFETRSQDLLKLFEARVRPLAVP